MLGHIQRLKDKAKGGPLSLAEQRELDHHEKVLAHTRIRNLEKEQQVIRSLPQPRELDPHKAKVLEEARAVLQRPVPGELPAAASSSSSIPDTTTQRRPDSGQPPRRVGDALSGRPGGLASAVADVSNHLNTQVPGLLHEKTQVFHSVEDLLKSDYAKQHPFSQAELDHLQSAEGFHDPQTGHSAIIAGNVEMRHGETPHDALTRVIRHERVGHDGLQTLLGSRDSKAQKHWEGLTQRIPQADLDVIAAQDGYKHLAGNRDALAHEWFARQAEKSPHLLNKPGLLRDMWEAFKGQLKKLSSHVKGTDESHLDADLHELLRLSRKSALKKPAPLSASTPVGSGAPARQFSIPGNSSQFSDVTGGSIYQQEHRQSDVAEKSFARPTEAEIVPQKSHTSGGRPELPEGAKLLQSSEHWLIFEERGKKWVRFYAPEARSPNNVVKGGTGSGTHETSAYLNPDGRIFVEEGQNRLTGVVKEGSTNQNTVPGHPQWLEYEYRGPTNNIGEPPGYRDVKPFEFDLNNPYINREGYDW